MSYDVTLIEADIQHAMLGSMKLGLETDGVQQAIVEYDWNDAHFTARFVGHAPTMPFPGHPVTFLAKPIEAIQKCREEKHQLPTDVFKDHTIRFEMGT